MLTLPHDASVELPRNPLEPNGSGNGYFRESNYSYTKEFTLDEAADGKNIWLEFEGVYHNAYVYINSAFAGKCIYGYSNFYMDITKFVEVGQKNNIKVIVKNAIPSGRWYTGGGIYRNVNLMIADRMHIIPDGVRLATMQLEDDLAVIRIMSELEYTGIGTRNVRLVQKLYDADNMLVARDEIPVTMEEHTKHDCFQRLFVENPKTWDAESPYLYHYRTLIMENGTVLDEECGIFGIRSLRLDHKHGLRVNGKSVNLRGGCIHHDNGIIGAAEFAHAEEIRIRELKAAGYNSIRSSHYPMSRQLLNECDRQGMYVMDEYSDVWVSTKVDFDYGMHMSDCWEHDIENMVRKDYNHPSVIMYSIGNEIMEAGNPFDVQYGKKLADRIRKLDDTRYLTNGLNMLMSSIDHMGEIVAELARETAVEKREAGEEVEINRLMDELGSDLDVLMASKQVAKCTEEASSHVDISGYNYAAARYEIDGGTYPNRIIVGTETFPKSLDINWELVEKLPYVIGDFSWTAWDYLGEAGIGKICYGRQMGPNFYADYPCKAAYCGDFNLIGDRRPISYWREIIWGFRKKPYIAVQPPQYHDIEKNMTNWSMTDAVRSWNWTGYEGKPVTVEVYTDADEVELYLNDTLLEKKTVGEIKKAIAFFETDYTSGRLEAVTYRNGKATEKDILITAEKETIIQVVVDRTELPADGSDIAYIDLRITDKQGNLNPEKVEKVETSIKGPGMILGYGSADPESEENYFDSIAATFEGRLRAAVRGTGKEGEVKVTFTSEDSGTAEVILKMV